MTDSKENGDIRRKLRAFLTARRIWLHPSYENLKEFSRATGAHYKTLQRIESETSTHRFSDGTLVKLDRTYRIPPGTIQRILEGETPPEINELAELPRHPGRPPIEARSPDIHLRGAPTLHAGEELTAWHMEDGRLHCRYTKAGDVFTAPITGGLPIEEVVKRVRMMADLAGM